MAKKTEKKISSKGYTVSQPIPVDLEEVKACLPGMDERELRILSDLLMALIRTDGPGWAEDGMVLSWALKGALGRVKELENENRDLQALFEKLSEKVA